MQGCQTAHALPSRTPHPCRVLTGGPSTTQAIGRLSSVAMPRFCVSMAARAVRRTRACSCCLSIFAAPDHGAYKACGRRKEEWGAQGDKGRRNKCSRCVRSVRRLHCCATSRLSLSLQLNCCGAQARNSRQRAFGLWRRRRRLGQSSPGSKAGPNKASSHESIRTFLLILHMTSRAMGIMISGQSGPGGLSNSAVRPVEGLSLKGVQSRSGLGTQKTTAKNTPGSAAGQGMAQMGADEMNRSLGWAMASHSMRQLKTEQRKW